jgi:hypothetical protein
VDRERGRGLDHREPELGAAFPTGRDPAPVLKPAVRPFDLPAVTAKRIRALGLETAAAMDKPGAGRERVAAAAAFADHRLDFPRAELLANRLAVVAAIGPQLRGPDPSGKHVLHQRYQVAAFVLVAGADPDRERRPARVDS